MLYSSAAQNKINVNYTMLNKYLDELFLYLVYILRRSFTVQNLKKKPSPLTIEPSVTTSQLGKRQYLRILTFGFVSNECKSGFRIPFLFV